MTDLAPAPVLLVNDRPENLLALEAILGDLGLDLVRATSGDEALRRLLAADYAAVLLDVRMSAQQGSCHGSVTQSPAWGEMEPCSRPAESTFWES